MAQRLQPEYLLVGEILRPHGIRGELRMRILTDYPERIPELGTITLAKRPDSSSPKRYHVEAMRMHKEYGLLKLKEIKDRTQAESMRGLFVMVHLQDAIPLEDDEIYAYELIGLRVVAEDGREIGAIASVLETGANDVYVIESKTHGELLFPVTDDTVLEINTEQGFVRVLPPDGLLPN